MIYRIKKQKIRKERQLYILKLSLLSLFYILFSYNSFAQDSIPEAKDLTEEKELKFQQFFFKALSHKSIGNYQKALENLESCNQILANDASVFFEFSKNYLQLNKTVLAKEYINRALQKNPNNIWMQKHLIKIHIKRRDFGDAIKVQQRLVLKNSKEREFLLRLYLQNRDYKKAISLMDDMETENVLPINFKRIKKSLEKRKGKSVSEEKTEDTTPLIDQFKTNKSYPILKQILKNSANNIKELLKYATIGIELFPAQPYVYLMKAKALNYQKKYKKALTTLKNGIDFVVEDKMEGDFYKEMIKSYKSLGNSKEEKKYQEKFKKLKI
ncbi:hypothetical protein DIS07_03845 [Polaribacter aquimarinus]|uniref:Uncharacterized protein n=1 Tax=Polaribacter aquimarinus TaxID=2100726 RepID=A0A2U2JB70_9FLAO|nr:hypothetical protein [uncultured Polaribacter sp.]PWG05586.1 hypothetical protein DIS07_03845 [Polaribacter aquimarinus]